MAVFACSAVKDTLKVCILNASFDKEMALSPGWDAQMGVPTPAMGKVPFKNLLLQGSSSSRKESRFL